MPELPEVETTIRYLQTKVKGKKILRASKSDKKLRKNLNYNDLAILQKSKIKDITRKAKYIIFNLNNEKYFIVHLGMSGRLKFLPLNHRLEKHDHLILTFNKFLIVLNDPRRFGMAFLIQNENKLNQFFSNYGYDIIKYKAKVRPIFNNITKKNITSKQMLLDQKFFVGIGNIYANEILFMSKISPFRKVSDISYDEFKFLTHCIKKILLKAIKNGGSSINDYKAPNGVIGSFQNMFKVYQKQDVLVNNKSYLVEKIVQNGRSSFYAPALQK